MAVRQNEITIRGANVNHVSFDEIKDALTTFWNESNEMFCYEIFWRCLEKKGLTTYRSRIEHARILIYPYVFNMLMSEFSERAFELERCGGGEEIIVNDEDLDSDVLTPAAVGWLLCDCMKKTYGSNYETCFTSDVYEAIRELSEHYRYHVADTIFDSFGEDGVLYLMWYAAVSPYSDEGEERTFENADEFDKFIQETRIKDIEADEFQYGCWLFGDKEHDDDVWNWLWSHSCANDDRLRF